MLKEIRCEQFIEKKLTFQDGLNTVLGDEHSTNSIGKSTLLMIIDFIFGGTTYIEKNSGAIKELGHHSFDFMFEFASKKFYYKRGTENPDTIAKCDTDYRTLSEIDAAKFREELKNLYKISNDYLSFRSIVGLYSRIWGKENYNVDKPLLSFSKEPEKTSIYNLIKLFNLYDSIADTEKKIKNQQESRKILTGLQKKNYIPKIKKSDFNKNKIELENIRNQVNDIKENLLQYTVNIEELSNSELLKLKVQKNELLQGKSLVQNKIKRLEINLTKKNIKSKQLKKLSAFFENPNEDKIASIESFHSKISSILKRELNAAKEILLVEDKSYQEEIDKIDLKISRILENVSSPKFIVDKVYDLTVQSNKLTTENRFYEEKENVIKDLSNLNERLDSLLIDIIKNIEGKINEELISINNEIHSNKRKIPKIKLGPKSYSFDHTDNTGTGKSYADLVEFDLAILKLTNLPFFIHDSILFKNIEDFAVDKIVEQYSKVKKQIFMSLDGINKFSKSSQDILLKNRVIQLSDKRKLFDRDWR